MGKTFVYVCIYVYVYMYTCIYVCLSVCLCMYVCMYVYMCVCMCVCMCACVYVCIMIYFVHIPALCGYIAVNQSGLFETMSCLQNHTNDAMHTTW